jgi:hypothetical protein
VGAGEMGGWRGGMGRAVQGTCGGTGHMWWYGAHVPPAQRDLEHGRGTSRGRTSSALRLASESSRLTITLRGACGAATGAPGRWLPSSPPPAT